MSKESAKKIMDDILGNSPEFAADMTKALEAERGESPIPVVKLTGRFNTAEKPVEMRRPEKPIAPVRRQLVLNGEQMHLLQLWERKFEEFLQQFFEDLTDSDLFEVDRDEVVEQFIKRNDIDEEWTVYKDNVEDEVPGQEIRDYPQSFLE